MKLWNLTDEEYIARERVNLRWRKWGGVAMLACGVNALVMAVLVWSIKDDLTPQNLEAPSKELMALACRNSRLTGLLVGMKLVMGCTGILFGLGLLLGPNRKNKLLCDLWERSKNSVVG